MLGTDVHIAPARVAERPRRDRRIEELEGDPVGESGDHVVGFQPKAGEHQGGVGRPRRAISTVRVFVLKCRSATVGNGHGPA